MRTYGKWFAGLMIGLLGGCFVSYDYTKFDESGAGGSGGLAVAASSHSSSSNGSGTSSSGMGGATGTCSDIVCDRRPDTCAKTDCLPLAWARRSGSGKDEQNARSVAISPMSNRNVAIAGIYQNGAFFVGTAAGPELPAGNPAGFFTEGFVAMYDGTSGTPMWAKPLATPIGNPKSYREARSIAFDSTENVVVAGVEGEELAVRHLFLTKFDANGLLLSGWPRTTLGGENSYTEAVAVATNGTDIYVYGKADDSSSAIINCTVAGAGQPKFEAGPFVARLDSNGNCIWLRSMKSVDIMGATPTAITVKNAATSGVWITGTATKTLNVGTYTLDPKGIARAFVARLGEKDGVPTAAYMFNPLMGHIEPMAIDTDGGSKVVLVGEFTGKTEFSMPANDAAKGAFIARIEPDAVNSASMWTPYSVQFSATGMPFPGARATGISWNNNTLYVSGIFAGTLNFDGLGISLTNVDNSGNTAATPFLAVLTTLASSAPTLVSFDAFPGGNASYNGPMVFLAGREDTIALAGGWLFDLDFSTVVGEADGKLPSVAGTGNADAFVAKFTP